MYKLFSKGKFFLIFGLFFLPHFSFAACTPPTQYSGQCISQTDLAYKVSLCNASGNQNSLACTESRACEASLSIYMEDSANYFNCKAAEENAATQAAANAAAKAEADRIANDQKSFDDAELNSCKNKLSQNFEVVNHVCQCKAGYTTQNNVCTDMNLICVGVYGEGGYSTTKDQLNCACKAGYVMSGKTCNILPKLIPVVVNPIVLQTPTPATSPVLNPVKKEIPLKKELPKTKTVVVNKEATTSSATSTIIATTTAIIPLVNSTTTLETAPVIETPAPVKEEKVGIIRRIWRAILSFW